MDNQNRFVDHLEHATEVVQAWPAWKQTMLGGVRNQQRLKRYLVFVDAKKFDTTLEQIKKTDAKVYLEMPLMSLIYVDMLPETQLTLTKIDGVTFITEEEPQNPF